VECFKTHFFTLITIGRKMRNVIEFFDNIVKKMDEANKTVARSSNSTGYGNRFFKMIEKKNNRIQSLGIYDYHTKKHVIFEMVNLVGQKDKIPQEFFDMEKLVTDVRSA